MRILGVPVSTLDLPACASLIMRWARDEARAEGPRTICATSVHGLIEGWRDPAFRAVLNDAALITPDGMPLVWVGWLRGRSGMSRVYGPDLMLEICRLSAGTGVRHFFYGGAPGIAERLADRLVVRFPGLSVAGWYSPPFRELTPTELEEVVARVNGASPDVVWAGLGTPRQERWAGAVRARLRAKVVATVGAAFDFHAGRLRQAPRLLQRAGLEWAYRLAQEPGRLWRRYLRNNPLFVILAGAELLGVTRFASADRTERRPLT